MGSPTPFSVAVNVSPQMLTHAEFLPRVKALKAALDAHKMGLTIELTEDSLVQGDASSLASIERLRKLGVDLAIDDFGKGYSSLTYLKQMPATEIKIDKRFIGTIAVDETDKQIVKTVIALAHALGMRVVAEGVDSAEGLAAVAELGCEMAQGFFIGRPMRGDLVPEWIDHYLRRRRHASCPSFGSGAELRSRPTVASTSDWSTLRRRTACRRVPRWVCCSISRTSSRASFCRRGCVYRLSVAPHGATCAAFRRGPRSRLAQHLAARLVGRRGLGAEAARGAARARSGRARRS